MIIFRRNDGSVIATVDNYRQTPIGNFYQSPPIVGDVVVFEGIFYKVSERVWEPEASNNPVTVFLDLDPERNS